MKKVEYISLRITTECKKALQDIASKKEWTLSHLASKILEDYTKNHSQDLDDKKTP